MPANIVRPGLEKYWERAKKRAADEGHEGDWPYVVGIYKRMTANKSMTAEPMAKSVMPPSRMRYFINAKQGGQVPDKRRLMELAEAYRPAKPATVARLLDSNKPMVSLRSVFEGLGMDPDAEASWRAMLGPAIEEAPNEIALRQAVYSVLRQQKADGELGSAILERALRYRKDKLRKSCVALVTVDELRKAEPKGGTYYRRVMGKSGRYRYYYDQDKYERSKEAHLDGEGASKRAIKGKVGALLQKAGKNGIALADLKPLTKRYGSKLVGGVLNASRDKGELCLRKGRLCAQQPKTKKEGKQ